MANYGIEIWRQDGGFFASPDYTPMVLCHVIDFSINVANRHGVAVATNVPAGMNSLVFYRAMANAAPGLPLYLSENGGYKWLYSSVNANTPSGVWRYRAYIFSNMVVSLKEYGMAFYNSSGVCVYTGTSLPLKILRGNQNDAQGYRCAVMPSVNKVENRPFDGGIQGGLTILYYFSGSDNGVVSTPYFVSQYKKAPIPIATISNYLYIDSKFYDDNYKFSLE